VRRYLFDFIEEIVNSLKAFSHVILFLDYDGTLVPICKDPSLAKLSFKGEKILKMLSKVSWLSVGIISGRSLKEVRKLVGIKDLFYVGNHGFEILLRGKVWVHPGLKGFESKLRGVASELKGYIKGINGILLEDRKISISVHYRNLTKKSPGIIFKIVSKVLEPYPEVFKITRGKKVYEIRPAVNWDKGKALVKLSKLIGLKTKALRIYIGDDQTDEDAFRVLEDDDISIRVGYRKGSKARYFCRGTSEVLKFIEQLPLLRDCEDRVRY